MDGRICVYLYSYWDEESQSRKTSKLYATFDAIRNGLGMPVYTSVIEIDVARLGEGGFYYPEGTAKAKPVE
jgi:hypothetical protein